ncbi:hypothetical protein LHEY10_06100 [Lactobacillus helveticus]|nr:hypothetical protein LHEY10_06100 [Lactobacillus helveticus]
MENSYSKSVNQVLEIAREQAQEFHHRLISTEHVLLAMVIETEGEAGKILRSWGLTPTAYEKRLNVTQAMVQQLSQATWKCHLV